MDTRDVTPLASFEGYPDGVKRTFVAGEPAKVSEAYARLLAAKGLIAAPAANSAGPDTRQEAVQRPLLGGRKRPGGGVSGASSISPDNSDEKD